ncbi:MAG: class II glutamine amidotransferase [Sediminimonas sp.]|uniref:class II glutamine amidotransferase n=1 Tax=Sediminimonas sp. TaxID=2823379 RepID=UPI0028709682|nr:class II glutamine amidotransferase [Sediminimonas sp.]MDR9485455.1 class II glutamine amidotransferase [Sediminimonas sp.]
MCRFLAWTGAARHLDEFVFKGDQCLVAQSRHALIGKTPLNGDGFGLAWYTDRGTPCIYKDLNPAWSDSNLKQIAYHTKAQLFLAHVRASTSMAVSRNNSHPFGVGPWCFMHNGQVGGHLRIRQALDAMIPADLYERRNGATDSEAIFLIAAGGGLDREPVAAMAHAVGRVETLARENGETPFMRFAACWTDGKRVFAARYASDRFAPSLYYKVQQGGVIICSEPLAETETWIEVPPGSAIETDGKALKFHEFAPMSLQPA